MDLQNLIQNNIHLYFLFASSFDIDMGALVASFDKQPCLEISSTAAFADSPSKNNLQLAMS